MGDPITVLLVDDFAPTLNAWERELRRDSYRILRATNRSDAIREAREQHPRIAIVDLFLAHESGLEVTRELKLLDPAIRIAMVSANASVACTMACVRAGADEVFPKPVTCRSLIASFDSTKREPTPTPHLTLAEIEWEAISAALLECDGNVSRGAATRDLPSVATEKAAEARQAARRLDLAETRGVRQLLAQQLRTIASHNGSRDVDVPSSSPHRTLPGRTVPQFLDGELAMRNAAAR